eukprot:TRINITY_DN3454_c0_g1_i2.p1 TRINITY_DN3454_c0_g1~~TRINITY_DN3454_c0_g1_i2.p1  ORF type:complete len:556 (+),score=60.05 TRINITY_DN3454_c0_g1_i2:72-1670(+)
MALSQHEQLAIGCAISLLLHAYRVAKSAAPWLKSCWSERSSVLGLWKRWRACTCETTAFDAYVLEQMERQLVSNIKDVIGVVAHAFNLLLCFTLFNIYSSSQLRLVDIQLWAVILIGACSTIGCIVPALVNRHTVHVWYAAFFLGCSFIIASSDTTNAYEIMRNSTMLISARALLSINYTSYHMVVVWNCVYCAAATYAKTNAALVGDSVRLRGEIALEVGALLAILYLSRTTVASLKREIQHQARATNLQSENSATTQLLEVMCDVVVELDGEKRIAENSESLAAMFAFNHTRGVKGTQLQDLMPFAEDRTKVDELLLTMSRSTGRLDPRLAHVTLRDSYGTDFRAELFFVHCSGLDRSSRYLAGIQENRDAPIAELRRNSSSQIPSGPPVASTYGCTQQNASLDNSESGAPPSNADHSGSADQPGEPLLHPHFKRTTEKAQVVSLMMALVSWNVVVPPRKCCAYHAALDEMNRIVKQFEQESCKPGFKQDFSAQCSHCGILDEWENVRESLQCPQCSRPSMTRGLRHTSL